MPRLTPVDYDPFAVQLTPVEHDPFKPEAGYGEIAGSAVKRVFPAFGKAVGGIIQAVQENTPKVKGSIEDALQLPDEYRDKTLTKEPIVSGRDIAKYWDDRLKGLQPDVRDGSAKYYINGILDNVARNAPWLAIGAATGGSTIPLMGFGIQAGGEKYYDMRSQGASSQTAGVGATVVGLSEALTEKLPLDQIIKAKSFAKKLLAYTALDVPGELVNTTIESAVDKVTVNPDMTWKDYGRALADTTIITLGSAGLLTSVSHPIVAARVKAASRKNIKLTPVEHNPFEATPNEPAGASATVAQGPVASTEDILTEGETNRQEYAARIRAESAGADEQQATLKPAPVQQEAAASPAIEPEQAAQVQAPEGVTLTPVEHNPFAAAPAEAITAADVPEAVISPRQHDPKHLEFLSGTIASGQGPGLIRDADGEVVGRHKSAYPQWFQNKGYTQKDILNIIDKAQQGKPLTVNQQDKLDDLVDSSQDDFNKVRSNDLIRQSLEGKTPSDEWVESDRQRLILIGGAPGSGKSSMIKQLPKAEADRYVIVNSDTIKDQAGYGGKRSAEFHEESSRIVKELLGRSIGDGYHTIYDSQMTNFPLADSAIQKTLDNGGQAQVAFVNTDAQTSAARAQARILKGEDAREVPYEAIVKGYNRSLPTFIELYQKYQGNPDVDFYLRDNNIDFENSKAVFEQKNGVQTIHNPDLFDKLMSTQYNTVQGDRYERIAAEKESVRSIKDAEPAIKQRARGLAARHKVVGSAPAAESAGAGSRSEDRTAREVAPSPDAQASKDTLNRIEAATEKLTEAADKFTEAFLKIQEVQEKPRKAAQDDMFGAKDGLEGKLTAKQVESALPLEQAAEEEKQREAMKGQGEMFDVGKSPLRATPAQLESIIREVERIAAPGVIVRLEDKIDIDKETLRRALQAWGEADLDKKVVIRGAHRVIRLNGYQFFSLIQLSLSKMDARRTPYHEAFHSVQELLLTEQEKQRLEQAYPDRFGVSSKERQAQAFANYVADKTSVPGRLRAIFKKILTFLTNLKSYLTNKRIESVADIFEAAYAGQLRERAISGTVNDDVSLDIDSDAKNLQDITGAILRLKESGKELSREEIFQSYDNTPVPIGAVSKKAAKALGVENRKVYTGKAYFIDHHFNHHPNIDIERYYTIPEILQNPDAVRNVSREGTKGFAFIKQYDKFHAVVVNIREKGDRLFLHKTFLAQRREPYKNIATIKNEPFGEGDISSIVQPDLRTTAEAISARPKDSSSDSNVPKTPEDVKGDISLDVDASRGFDKLMRKAQPDVRITTKKPDIGIIKGLLASPDKLAGKARYYVVHAKNAMHKQDRLRSIVDDKLADIFNSLSKKQMDEFEQLSWQGDAESKTYTTAELDDMGISPAVAKAYLAHRKFHEQVYRLMAAHRKAYGASTGHIEGHIPHMFENWNVYELVGEADPKTGHIVEKPAGIVGTFRSLREAAAFAKGLDPKKKFAIKPKTFKLPDEVIAKSVLKDISYAKMVDRVEEAFEMSANEAADLVSGVARRKGRHRFIGNVMQRKGQSGYKTDDLRGILKQYYHSVSRYVALDDFKSRTVPKFEKDFGVELGRASQALRDKNMARYIEEYINDVNGMPGMIEDMIDASIRKYAGSLIRSERPTIWLVNKALHFTGVMKLGLFNLSSGVVNLTQLINTFSKLPTSRFAAGFARGLRPSQADNALLRRIGVSFDLGLANTGGYSIAHQGGKAVKASMIFFSGAEHINRRVTALSAYGYAKHDLKLSDKQAALYARQMVDQTQFDYSIADTARIFRNPAGRLLGQFKPYAIKQLEFITGLHGVENIKFWIPMLLLAGAGGVPMAEGLAELLEWLTGRNPLIETKAFLMRWAGADKERRRVAEITMYGVASQLGIDISKRSGISDMIPRRAQDLLGPTINTITRAKELAGKDKTEFVRSISPSLGNILTAIETVANNMDVADPYRRQRHKYTASTLDVAAKAAGFRPLHEAIQSDIKQAWSYEKAQYTATQQRCVDDAIEAIMSGDAEGVVNALQKAADKGVIISSESLQNEIVQKLLPEDIRLLLQTRKIQRPDYLDLRKFGGKESIDITRDN